MKRTFDNEKLINKWRKTGHADADICEVIGISRPSMSRKIKNKSDFSATQVIMICDHIEEPMDMFIVKAVE